MRFPIASLFFVVLTFVFFGGYCVTSFMLTTVQDNMSDIADDTLSGEGHTMFNSEMDRMQDGFGIASVMSLLLIVISYVVDVLRQDDREYIR